MLGRMLAVLRLNQQEMKVNSQFALNREMLHFWGGNFRTKGKFNSILSISQQAGVPKLRYKAQEQEQDRVLFYMDKSQSVWKMMTLLVPMKENSLNKHRWSS